VAGTWQGRGRDAGAAAPATSSIARGCTRPRTEGGSSRLEESSRSRSASPAMPVR
jgi:hypothetical protein